MDTPIRLTSSKVQVAFLGKISDQRLQRMKWCKNPLIITTIKWVLDKDFIDDMDKYHVNTDISSHFIASLLDTMMIGYLISELTKALFSLNYLSGLEEMVAH